MTRRSSKSRLCALLLGILLCALPLLGGCSDAVLEEAASILLEEWAAQQMQQAQPSAAPKPPSAPGTAPPSAAPETDAQTPVHGEAYYTPADVAAYLHRYGELPPNYITKEEARARGWVAAEGNLWDVAPGACIGGDHFGNYEGSLPDAPKRSWRECDVDYTGGHRGASRLVYSNDGLIYYSDDHYESFTRLY